MSTGERLCNDCGTPCGGSYYSSVPTNDGPQTICVECHAKRFPSKKAAPKSADVTEPVHSELKDCKCCEVTDHLKARIDTLTEEHFILNIECRRLRLVGEDLETNLAAAKVDFVKLMEERGRLIDGLYEISEFLPCKALCKPKTECSECHASSGGWCAGCIARQTMNGTHVMDPEIFSRRETQTEASESVPEPISDGEHSLWHSPPSAWKEPPGGLIPLAAQTFAPDNDARTHCSHCKQALEDHPPPTHLCPPPPRTTGEELHVKWVRNQRDKAREEARLLAAENEALALDARRYRRIRVLGCAVMGHPNLDEGMVSRFSNLDAILDNDLKAHPSRGEESR